MTQEPPQHPTAAAASSALLALLLAPFLLPPPMISLVSVWSRAEFMLPDLPRPDRTLPDLSRGFPPFKTSTCCISQISLRKIICYFRGRIPRLSIPGGHRRGEAVVADAVLPLVLLDLDADGIKVLAQAQLIGRTGSENSSLDKALFGAA